MLYYVGLLLFVMWLVVYYNVCCDVVRCVLLLLCDVCCMIGVCCIMSVVIMSIGAIVIIR